MARTVIDPVSDVMVIERLPGEVERTSRGYYIPETAERGVELIPERGRVLAVGPGKTNLYGVKFPPPAQVGEVVVYNRGAGTNVIAGEERHHCIAGWDLIAIGWD